MKINLLALAFLLLLSASASAQFRKYSNEFLNIGAGARGLAMGSSQVASVQDGTSGYWNPAGLTGVELPSVNLMHAEYFSGIGKYDYLSFATPTANGKRTLGFTALRFGIDDIANTLFLIEKDGTVNFDRITSFSAADYAFMLSLAQKIKETANRKITFGLNTKVIYRHAGTFAKSWGFGLDAGLQIHTKKWKFGFVGRDVTTTFNTWTFNFSGEEKEALYLTQNEIPTKSSELTAPRLVVGAGRDFKIGKKSSLLAEANIDITFDGKRNTVLSADPISADPKIGLEYNINNAFFVRAGINNFQRALDDGDSTNSKRVWVYQPSAGAGFKAGNVYLDYAFVNLANQSSPLFTHVFSLRVDFINNKNKK